MLSSTSDYALRAILVLAQATDGRPLRADQIARATASPANYLAKTLNAQDNNNANVAAANRTVVRYVIERMCLAAGPAQPSNCDMMPPKQNPGTTVHDESTATLNPIPFYRVTIRVDGPQNTASFLQAMLR